MSFLSSGPPRNSKSGMQPTVLMNRFTSHPLTGVRRQKHNRRNAISNGPWPAERDTTTLLIFLLKFGSLQPVVCSHMRLHKTKRHTIHQNPFRCQLSGQPFVILSNAAFDVLYGICPLYPARYRVALIDDTFTIRPAVFDFTITRATAWEVFRTPTILVSSSFLQPSGLLSRNGTCRGETAASLTSTSI